MNSKNAALENSLQCLRHPLTVFSIVLLVLNDNVLKVFVPSELTGKLSDFAGLFFFPFLVAALLSLARFEISTGRIGVIAVGGTGLWFFLLKMTPLVNSLSAQGASIILGRPVAYALDPSDILALIMLLPAWWLWNKPKQSAPSRLAWGILTVAALASLATSPALVMDAHQFLYEDDQLFYKLSVIDTDRGLVAKSLDLGDYWDSDWKYDADKVLKDANLKKVYPIQACDPYNQQVCYRTLGNGTVEMTSDAGASWQIVWSLPFRRLRVMEMINNGSLDAGPYDLLILPDKVTHSTVLLVALGHQGVLRCELPNGEWRQRAVAQQPTPSIEPDFNRASIAASWAWVRWEAVSIFALLALSWWLQRKIQNIAALPERKHRDSFVWLAFGTIVYLLLAGVFLFPLSILFSFVISQSDFFFTHYPVFTFVVGYLAPFVWLLVYVQKNAAQALEKPSDTIAVTLVSGFSALGILLVGIFPIIFWIQGIIEQDIEVVLWTVPLLTCIIIGWFSFVYWRVFRSPRQADLE